MSVDKLKGTALSVTALASGNFLKYNGTNWVNVAPSSSDLSDGASLIKSSQMPANCSAGQTLTFSSPTGSWVCSSIAVTPANFSAQSANTVLAGPSSGSSAAPTFRALVAADLPASASYWSAATGGINYASGMVGIGTGSPRAGLDVNAPILGKPSTSNATATIDFSTGNTQHTSSSCGSFQMNNLKDGASYIFIVKGTTSATCSFTAYSDAGSTALTVHMPPGHGATTSGTHTLYNMLVSGGDVYFAWTPGY